MVDLTVDLAGLRLRNPLMSASGTFGHGLEMGGFVPPGALGAWVSKTVTLEPRHGNPAPRICETEAGFLNSIGLENKGVDHYEGEVLPTLAGMDAVVVTNIGGKRLEDYLIKPVQRLTKYPLFFKELLKALPDDDPELTRPRLSMRAGARAPGRAVTAPILASRALRLPARRADPARSGLC